MCSCHTFFILMNNIFADLFSSRIPIAKISAHNTAAQSLNRYKRATTLLHQQGVQRELIITLLVVWCISH